MPYISNPKININGGNFINEELPHIVLFNKKYSTLPSLHDNAIKRLELTNVYDIIINSMRSIDESLITKKQTVLNFKGLFEQNKSIWMLRSEHVADKEGFQDKLADFIIAKQDTSLTPSDYALLYKASLDKGSIQDSLENIPLFMLHDMYAPLMEAEIETHQKTILSS
jgi:hypothetical protein